MTRQPWLIIEDMGMLWKLSPAAYRRLLQALAAGDAYQYRDFGRLLGSVHRNLTDFTAEMAQSELDYERTLAREKRNRSRR